MRFHPTAIATVGAFGVWCGAAISAISVLRPLLMLLSEKNAPGWGFGILIITLLASTVMCIISYLAYDEAIKEAKRP